MEQLVTKELPVFVWFHGFFQWCGVFVTAVSGGKNAAENAFPLPEKKQERESLCLLTYCECGIFPMVIAKIGWRR